MTKSAITLLNTVLFSWCVISPAQTQSTRAVKSIWHKSEKGVDIILDRIVPHEPPFVGDDKRRARLRFLNSRRVPIFVEAFDLTSAPDDKALLHDVFTEGTCREIRNGRNINSGLPGRLGIGYSRIDTSSTIEVAPGASLLFSVPLDHLSNGRCVRVRYWDGSDQQPVSEDGYRYLWFGPSRRQ